MASTPNDMQSSLQGSAPKDVSVTLSVNEASIQFLAIDNTGKEVGNVVMSRDEYRDADESDLRKKLFGNRKAADPKDRKNEASNGEETAVGKTAAKLGIQESVLRQKANEDPADTKNKEEVAEKGIVATKVERETGKDMPHPPVKPHDTSVKTPNPADAVGADRSPVTPANAPAHDTSTRTNTPTPGTITHDFQIGSQSSDRDKDTKRNG